MNLLLAIGVFLCLGMAYSSPADLGSVAAQEELSAKTPHETGTEVPEEPDTLVPQESAYYNPGGGGGRYRYRDRYQNQYRPQYYGNPRYNYRG